MKRRNVIVFTLLCVLIGLMAFLFMSIPTHERAWQSHYARTPDASIIEDGVVRLKNVRDWRYSDGGVTDERWLDEVVIVQESVAEVWFILSLFSDSPLVGHSFLTFVLTDGRAYTFSIEARREIGEEYSAWFGLLRRFELWYGWGTEHDFIGASHVLLGRPLELYQLDLTPDQRAMLVRSIAQATHEVAENPRFYNTLTANCTNLLAHAINAQRPGTIPYDLSWHFPGLAPAFLAERGFIMASTSPLLREEHRLEYPSDTLKQVLAATPELFGAELRTAFKKRNLD